MSELCEMHASCKSHTQAKAGQMLTQLLVLPQRGSGYILPHQEQVRRPGRCSSLWTSCPDRCSSLWTSCPDGVLLSVDKLSCPLQLPQETTPSCLFTSAPGGSRVTRETTRFPLTTEIATTPPAPPCLACHKGQKVIFFLL